MLCTTCQKEKPEEAFRADSPRCVDCRRAYQRAWRAQHPERVHAYRRTYRLAHADAIRARNQRWNQTHRRISVPRDVKPL